MEPKSRVYLVIDRVRYKGDLIKGIFSERSDAHALRSRLEKEDDSGAWSEFVVEEWELQ